MTAFDFTDCTIDVVIVPAVYFQIALEVFVSSFVNRDNSRFNFLYRQMVDLTTTKMMKLTMDACVQFSKININSGI